MGTSATAAVRAQLKQQRRSLDPELIASASDEISRQFWQRVATRRALNIGVYMCTAGEVDCGSIIATAWQRKKRVFAPVLRGRRLVFAPMQPSTKLATNRFGILEPVYQDSSLLSLRQLDIVITPLLAFDRQLNRIGMGAGYYDRSFAFSRNQGTWQHPLLVGVAYSFQRIAAIRPNSWDVPLHVVITEKECIRSY